MKCIEWSKYLKSMENVAEAGYFFLQIFGVDGVTTFPLPDATLIREAKQAFAARQRIETGIALRRCRSLHLRTDGSSDTEGYTIQNFLMSGHIAEPTNTDAGVFDSLRVDRLLAFTRLACKDGKYLAQSLKRILELDEYKSEDGDVHMILYVDTVHADGASDVTKFTAEVEVLKGEELQALVESGRGQVAGELIG